MENLRVVPSLVETHVHLNMCKLRFLALGKMKLRPSYGYNWEHIMVSHTSDSTRVLNFWIDARTVS